jgi:hypothetical protein
LILILETRDFTLLRKWVTSQNLRNDLPFLCQHLPDETSRSLLDFITQSKSVGEFSQAMSSNKINSSPFNYDPQKLETLDLETHKKLVQSLKHEFSGQAALSTSVYTSWQKKEGTILIPRLVHQHKSIKTGHITYTPFSQHAGNSTIFYHVIDSNRRKQTYCGQISQIFTMSYSTKKDMPSQIHLWFEVERFGSLSPSDQQKHKFEDWPYVRAHIVYDSKKKKDYVEMNAVIGHGATCKLPPACFGISKKALLIFDLSKKVSQSSCSCMETFY